MPSENVDGLGADGHGTDDAARHRRNSQKQSTSTEHTGTAAYTEEQCEAVKRYKHFCKYACCIMYNVCQYV